MKSIALAGALLAAFAAQAEPTTYAVDPSHAAVFYAVQHFGTSTNRGRFNVKSGTVTIDPAAKTGHVDLTIDTSKVDTGIPALDKHMSSADFFDMADFPTATFVADQIAFNGDKVASVSGQLTLHGKTNPVTLSAANYNCYINPMMKRQVCGGDFTTTIKRSLWGVSWGLNFGFPDDTPLTIQVEAVKQ